ncbi:tail fiber protein [Pseudomonas phage vB_PsyP_3MF5]|uniref:tail fiber protein n=1 Tax=Pseudomonas phage vB_PsyP_3MF5 TaxID=2749426 RepID=UPI001BD959A1|nr:tail fiber protein [Pseudomonas phage vB_PsyP_3MF5]QLI47593.1 tail fiber protein [Pseudomonas phage vB_PsyP_3MF5]
MAITTVYTYPLNGSQQDFTVPFEYLARRFVSVTLIGTAGRRKLILTTDFRFTSSTSIRTNVLWTPASGYSWIEVRRETSASERLVDFTDGSILRASDMNVSQVQTLHVAEEARNAVTDTIGTDTNGNLDARARRIVNVADAVDPGDAVNLHMNQQWAGSALNQANRSEQQANASANSASQSASSASAAATSVTLTAQYRDTTLTYRNAAETFKNQAGSSQSAAAASETSASKWAANPEDQPVADSRYSSLHYSRKSAASATASANSASASAAQVPLAAAEADRAKTEADRAKTEADKLGNMNSLGGALDTVSGTTVIWKDKQSSKTGGFEARLGADNEANFSMTAADGSDPIRLVRTADRIVHLYDNSGGGDRMLWSSTGVTIPKNLTVNGVSTFVGNAAFSGQITAGTIVSGGSVRSNSGMFASFASSASSNAHLWFYDNLGNTRGIIYAQQSNIVTLQAGSAVAANFHPDGRAAFNNMTSGSQDAQGRIAAFRNGVWPAAGMYQGGHFMAQTDDGSCPSYGFHRGGSYALALYLSGNSLFMMDSSGLNREVLNNTNLGAWLISVGEQGVGSYAFCRAAITATYGMDLAGGNISYGSTGANGGSCPGTWRSRGWAGGGNHTLFQRVA